jgi:hypothetical protein
MTILTCVVLIIGYVYEDSDSLLVDNDTLTLCGDHQYALKVHIKNYGQLFVRSATGAPDSTGWLKLDAPLIIITDHSIMDGSERGHSGAYMNSHPWGYGPGGGGAGGVSGGAGGGGAYGGAGGVGGDNYGGSGGVAYGDSADTLIDMGSGGGAGRLSVVDGAGGDGGASLSLRGTVIMVDSSEIRLSGQRGTDGSVEAGGGGSGGGLMIWSDTVRLHSVVINASGGNGGDASFGGGGGAGGGRIKIFYSQYLDTSAITAYVNGGGAGSGNYGNPQPGTAGSFHIGIPTGIQEIVSTVPTMLKLAPNPTRGNIRFTAERPPGEVVVYGCDGRVVAVEHLDKKTGMIQLDNVLPGIYFLKSDALKNTPIKIILLP